MRDIRKPFRNFSSMTHPSASMTSLSSAEAHVDDATTSGALKASRSMDETSELFKIRTLSVESAASSFCVLCEWWCRSPTIPLYICSKNTILARREENKNKQNKKNKPI